MCTYVHWLALQSFHVDCSLCLLLLVCLLLLIYVFLLPPSFHQLKLRQQKDKLPRGTRQTSSSTQRPNTAPNIPSVQFTPHVITTSRAHITPSYTQGHTPSIHSVPMDPRVNFDGSLPVVPPSFPAWCSLPAGTAAPGGGSFFTFSTTPSQYLPTHWHPMGAVPHCQLFKHVAPVRGPTSVPYANFPLQDISTTIIPPLVIGDVPAHVSMQEEELPNMPGPSHVNLIRPNLANQGEVGRESEGSRNSRSAYFRDVSASTHPVPDSEASPREMSPSNSLLTALRGIRMTSSSSNSSPVMSPLSNTSASSTSSIGSPSSDVSSGWQTSTSTENSPREEFNNEPDVPEAPNYIDQPNLQSANPLSEGIPLVEIQQRIRRSRRGNFYLSGHSVASPLEALANAATVLEGRLVPHHRPSEQTLSGHPSRQEQNTIPNTVLQVPLAQEPILQPSIFPSVPVFVPPADTLPANVQPPLPHIAAPIPLAMPHPHSYPSTWTGHNIHQAPGPSGPNSSTSTDRPRNLPTE